MAKAAVAAVQAAEDAERERKRDAIRQRIAAAKAAQAAPANGEAPAAAGGAGGADQASQPGAEASAAIQENLARQMDLGAHASADLQHHDGHQVSAAEAEAAGGGMAHAYPVGGAVYQVLPLPTEEAGTSEGITYKTFDTEAEMAEIVALIDKDLSEPYSIFTYRYFVYNWPQHTHMAMAGGKVVAVAVSKLEKHREYFRGYVAMLAVDNSLRGKGIGSCLVAKSIRSMREEGCEEIVLETECSNAGALRLYENLGFYRDKRLLR
eukprot:CAMPEP_0180153356 /NCGR_PEP_ID=MMETSP0986-20121125/23464_1 /TAXON_ID=697907 /ORGANISM="non described non described, Strain CCMP2293" /LENGTH=264 /DNA_ID=CAMNT_0022101403 /DNA_START=51 /DNA_END=843 /DNA_ORIENTATION=+